jgi:hypothetical protein
MSKKYRPDVWDLDHLLDSTIYEEQARCVDFIEDQIDAFDERNDTELMDRFVPLIRVSFLLACVAKMEHHLKKICDVVAETRNLAIRPTDLRGANGFESCVEYLRKVLQVDLPEKNLKGTRSIVALRNAWVHHGGYMEALPQELGKAAAHIARSPEGQIEFIDENFFREASTTCRTFVDAVVDVLTSQSKHWAAVGKARKRPKKR